MKDNKYGCPLEHEVRINIESGDIKPHIREHLATCHLCQETELVIGWLQEYRQVAPAITGPDPQLPSAERIWEEAFTLTHSPALSLEETVDPTLFKKAMLPLVISQYLMYATLLGGFLYLMISNMPGLQKVLKDYLGLDLLFRSLASFAQKGSNVPAITLVSVAIALLLLVGMVLVSEFNQQDKGKGKKRMAKI